MKFGFKKNDKENSRFKKGFSNKKDRKLKLRKFNILHIFKNGLGILLLVGIVGGSLYFGYIGFSTQREKHVAVNAVNDMFTFKNYEVLHDVNMPALQEITTQQVYDEVTFTNLQTALNAYLPFFGHATQAQILSVSDTSVTFRIINPSTSLEELYTMYYKTNFWGEIDFLKVYKCTPMFSK